jgi:hypothetical protein
MAPSASYHETGLWTGVRWSGRVYFQNAIKQNRFCVDGTKWYREFCMTRILEHVIGRPVLEDVAHLAHQPELTRRLDHRAIRIAILLSLVIALNFTDLAYTLFAQSIGMLHEQNPIAASFLTLNPGQTLVCYKLLMLLAGTFMLWKMRHHRCTIVGCWVLVSAYACLGVVWWMWVQQMSQIFDTGSHVIQHIVR